MNVKTDVVYTAAEHGLTTGEEVYYGREVYYARVLDANSILLYADTSLTTLVTDLDTADFVIPRDQSPDIDIYARSRYTNDGRGILGAYIFETSITTNVTNYNIATAATAAGWDGNSVLYANITVNAGIYVYSTTTSTAALSTGTVPDNSKIEITNNGYIMGQGGYGGGEYFPGPPDNILYNPVAGGPAMDISFSVTITNNSYIAGGGGGGGGGNSGDGSGYYETTGGGGGAGGGRGGDAGVAPGVNALGGAGGALGQVGSNGTGGSFTSGFGSTDARAGGGGGGRILPGSVSLPNPGRGGQAGGNSGYGYLGGTTNQPGQSGATFGGGAGGGGGWGASGGAGGTDLGNGGGVIATFPAGTGGRAIKLNGNTATFVVSGTVYGAIS